MVEKEKEERQMQGSNNSGDIKKGSNKDLLPQGNNIIYNSNRGNNNILLYPPSIQSLLHKHNVVSNNDLLPLSKDFYFQWMSLFRLDVSEVYRAIIYFLVRNKVCYVGGLARVLGCFKQNMPVYLRKLEELFIIKKVDNESSGGVLDFLKSHRKAFRLTDTNLDRIQFYELTEFARDYFSEFDFWDSILKKSTIESIENWRNKLSKSHKKVEKEIKMEKQEFERDAAYYHERKHDPRYSEMQRRSWIEAKAEKYGIPPEKLIEKWEKMLAEDHAR